jgi:hypothetical protein
MNSGEILHYLLGRVAGQVKKNQKNIFKNLWFSRVFFYPFWLISVCIFIP